MLSLCVHIWYLSALWFVMPRTCITRCIQSYFPCIQYSWRKANAVSSVMIITGAVLYLGKQWFINVFVLTVIWVSSCVRTSCKMILCLCTAAERAHRVTPQASWLPSGPPREEEEEGEPWGARAIAQSPKDDRPQSQTLPQAETRWEDPDEEDVSVTSASVWWQYRQESVRSFS